MRTIKRRIRLAAAVALGAALVATAALAATAESDPPLAAYPGFGHHPEQDEQSFTEEERQREALVAECMDEHGYRYVPSPSILVTGEEWEPPSFRDPNADYVAGLSPAERTGYYLALTGVPDPNAQEAAAQTPSTTGCVAEAIERIPGVYAARGALAEEYDELQRAIARDRRVVAARDHWSECMRRHGFRYTSMSAMEASTDEAVARRLEAGARGTPAMAQADEARSAALAASASCDDDLERAARSARHELERAFVDDHRAVLDHYRR